jgi:hypothetical protein
MNPRKVSCSVGFGAGLHHLTGRNVERGVQAEQAMSLGESMSDAALRAFSV